MQSERSPGEYRSWRNVNGEDTQDFNSSRREIDVIRRSVKHQKSKFSDAEVEAVKRKAVPYSRLRKMLELKIFLHFQHRSESRTINYIGIASSIWYEMRFGRVEPSWGTKYYY